MWIYNKDTKQWSLKEDYLNSDDFEYLKQEYSSYRLYSKCLSGSTYLYTKDLNNIYDILNYQDDRTWYISPLYSKYITNSNIIENGNIITNENSDDFYIKNISEYNLTLKNLFTPEKLINDSIGNFISVDLATTEEIENLSAINDNLYIDGIRLINGHTILIKDQVSTVILPNTINPDDYFTGDYKRKEEIGINIKYEYHDSENGIYKYINNVLIKQDSLNNYNNNINLSIYVKLGNYNADKKFNLKRLNNGYFPIDINNDPIIFKEAENWILRNQLDYNNLLDINYNDIIIEDVINYYIKEDSFTYSIPKRVISVGEFGTILINQNDISSIIRNKYKKNLNSISINTQYYWVVGDGGTILKIKKHNLDIESVEIYIDNELMKYNLKSISFLDDLNAIIIGDYNTILITENGGNTWFEIKIDEFDSYSYNSCLYLDIDNFYISGNNGIFLHFFRNKNIWKPHKRRISKFKSSDEEYKLIDNINKIIHIKSNNLSFSNILLLACDDNKIIIHDLNNNNEKLYDFLFLENNGNYGDIRNIIYDNSTSIYFTGDDQINIESGIFKLDINSYTYSNSNILKSITNPTKISNIYANSFILNNNLVYICGNNSVLKYFDNSYQFYDLDNSFIKNLKSKLLFLDYDVANKLNFFSDDGEYRLPNNIIINNISNIEQSGFNFGFRSNEIINGITYSKTYNDNWITYEQDNNSTFEYYSTEPLSNNSKILPSFNFRKIDYTEYNTLIINKENITSSIDEILGLAPSLIDNKNSRFNAKNSINISLNDNYTLYLYDFLMVLRVNKNEFKSNIGDILRLESKSINLNLIINKIINTDLYYNYLYLYTEFDNTIINSLINENIKITNLNTYTDNNQLIENLNKHMISKAYDINIDYENDTMNINAKFNKNTAYYNLQTDIYIQNINNFTYSITDMCYDDSYIKFGYKPNYNILDYLSNINDSYFHEDKEYLVMPVYEGINLSNNIGPNACKLDNNKILMGVNLKLEWDTLLINTFVDITVGDDNKNIHTDELLIIDKYIDTENNLYIIEFNKKINLEKNLELPHIDIASRRKLSQISKDLSKLNNIQTNINNKEYKGGSEKYNESWSVKYPTYNKELKFKFNTDSYAKILLSDSNTRKSISGIIYTDYKNELALNITKLEINKKIRVINTESGLNHNIGNKLVITTNEKHNLSENEFIFLSFDDITNSSYYTNPEYSGHRIILKVINDFKLALDVDYGSDIIIGNDMGYIEKVINDPFLNYQPIDLISLGNDKIGKISIELKPKNTILYNNNDYKLINVNFENYRFKLIDGLDILQLSKKFSWIYEAEITNAVIGLDNSTLIWYKGIWECGRWFGGKWISGKWISGDWYDGEWNSNEITDLKIKIEIDAKSTNSYSSKWLSGRWYGGTWNNGSWINGRWYDGVWNKGIWYNGIWNNGTWNSGNFNSGTWVQGIWNSGTFNTINGPAFWLDGIWNSGDFENGIWYNGTFNNRNGESRFGINSYLSRPSIWKSGIWENGSFHSMLKINNLGEYDIADNHNLSTWETGRWLNGHFYGGIAHNIDFKSGVWHGGVLEDIKITGLTGSNTNSINYFILDGSYTFNIGDEITLIDNGVYSAYSYYGSNDNPSNYKILYSSNDEVTNSTKIYIDKQITHNLQNSEIPLRLVSKFKNSTWKTGIWTNGIFENGIWESGIWYNGIFKGTWM